MKIYFIFFTIVFGTVLNLFAMEYPTGILNKSFAIQYKVLDSLRGKLNDGDYSTSLSYYRSLEEWAAKEGDQQLQLAFRYEQHLLTFHRDRTDSALEKNINDLVKELNVQKFYFLKAQTQQLLGEFYWEKKEYAASLENYIYAYENYHDFSVDDFPPKSEFLYQLGGRYYYFRDYKTARQYFLAVWKEIPVEKIGGAVTKLNTLALSYSNSGEYDSSSYYFHMAEDIAIKENDELWLGILSGNLGNNYVKQNRISEAIPLLEKNIALSRKHRLMDDLALSLSEYGEILRLQNNFKKDLELQKEALQIVYNRKLFNNNTIISRIYLNVARAYAANGNRALAYVYLDSAGIAKDIVEKEKNMVFVSGVQHKIDIEKHMAELQGKENELKHQKTYRNSLLGGLTVMLLFTGVFFLQRNRISREKKISDMERQRSEQLLLNILPAEVAEELKATGGAKAKSFDKVSVLFTDFVNFTQLSEKLGPQELVEEIHFCFTAFDKIIEQNGLEKIKTIGDAYLAVCGMPVEYAQHAQRTVQAAIEIRNFMLERQTSFSDGRSEIFHIRIGINSGPVVAGIVGVKKFAYDIWGDTVNTAARMEQNSENGKINISGSTYELVKNDFHCEYRGKIEAKNKGKVDMYYVS